MAGYSKGLLEARFHRLRLRDRPRQEQHPLEPMQLCFPVALSGFFHHCQRFGEHGKPFLGLSRFPTGLGEHGEKGRPS